MINRKIFGIAYYHHGLYISKDEVIHYQNSRGWNPRGARVRATSLDKFIGNSKGSLYVIQYENSNIRTVDESVAEARQDINPNPGYKYDPFKLNCEHFVTKWKTGTGYSLQGNFWKGTMTRPVGKLLFKGLVLSLHYHIAINRRQETEKNKITNWDGTKAIISSKPVIRAY